MGEYEKRLGIAIPLLTLWYNGIIICCNHKKEGREKQMTEKVRNITIRLTSNMWKKLRRMQEDDKIRSIQQACIEGLKHVIKERGD